MGGHLPLAWRLIRRALGDGHANLAAAEHAFFHRCSAELPQNLQPAPAIISIEVPSIEAYPVFAAEPI
jgi:hypothetical protein